MTFTKKTPESPESSEQVEIISADESTDAPQAPVVDSEERKTPDPKLSKRMTAKAYSDCCRDYESGEHTLRSLSKKYDVSVTNLTQRFKRDGIEKNSLNKRIAEAKDEAIAAEAKDFAFEWRQIREYNAKMAAHVQRTLISRRKRAEDEADTYSFAEYLEYNELVNLESKNFRSLFAQIEESSGLTIEEEESAKDIEGYTISILDDDQVQIMRENQRREEAMLKGIEIDEDED